MASLWSPSYHSDTDSDSDMDRYDDMMPPGVDETLATGVHTLKWKLYQIIVLGPELNTPEAQQNELLQAYIRQLERLYRILEKALKGAITDTDLRPFPVSLRHEILTLATKLKGQTKLSNRHAADYIPYLDFLKETLRMYPFVHRSTGGSVDVESL